MIKNIIIITFLNLKRKSEFNNIVSIFKLLFLFLSLIYTYLSGNYIINFTSKLLPSSNLIDIFLSLFIFYLAIDFFVKFYIKKEKHITLKTLFILPVSRHKIINIYILNNLFHKSNYFIILFFSSITINYKFSFIYLLIIIISILYNSIFILFLRKIINKNLIISFIPFLFVILIFVLQYFKVLNLFQFSNSFFLFFVNKPINILFYLFSFSCLYLIIHLFFVKNYQKIFINPSKHIANKINQNSFFNNYFLDFETKLIFRNTKTRTVFISVIIGYILLNSFFLIKGVSNNSVIFFTSFILTSITGLFIVSYGIYSFGFENSFLKLIFILPINLNKYIRTKLLIFSFSIIAIYLISVLYFIYLEIEIIRFTTFACFHLGINQFLFLIVAILFKNKVNLKTILFISDNVYFISYLGFLLNILPVVIWYILSLFIDNKTIISTIIIGSSFCSLLFIKYWIKIIEHLLQKNKYKKLKK